MYKLQKYKKKFLKFYWKKLDVNKKKETEGQRTGHHTPESSSTLVKIQQVDRGRRTRHDGLVTVIILRDTVCIKRT